jgi:hypothetical protein
MADNICERCNANDGRDVRERKVEKGESTVKRLLCDPCAELVNATYEVHPLKKLPKAPEAEAETQDQESESASSSQPRRGKA